MKKFKSYILTASALVAAVLGGCSDEYSQPPVVIPEESGVIGDGSWENPLQAWQVNLGTVVGPDERTSNWCTGYIVGWIDTSVSNTMSEATFQIGVPCNVNTNMVIAQYPYYAEGDAIPEGEDGKPLYKTWEELGYTWEDCVTVQLPSGGVRDALNLVDNKGNFNKQVSLRGTTGSKYCGAYGIRSTADYNWGPQGKYEEPITPVGSSYYCNFDISADINYYIERGWKNVAMDGGLSGWYVKSNSGQQFATCSAYLGTQTGGPYENWLISPGIDIDNADAKTVSFSTQAGYTSPDSNLTVWLLTASSPKNCQPVQLECSIAEVPSSGFSKWVSSGDIDLSGFSGKIYIGFRYYASQGGQGYSSEFHIDNFNLGGAEVPVDPDQPVIEPAVDKTFVKATEVKSGKKYALAHAMQVAIPIQEDYSYGYLYVTPFQRVTADSFITSTLNAFLFEKEGDGYSIRDYYGRYLYMDASHTSFQVSAQKPSANYLWKVEADGGVFKISNIGRGNVIDWVSNYSNFSTVSADSYSGTGPALYEMQD